jgi:hypothetical protein
MGRKHRAFASHRRGQLDFRPTDVCVQAVEGETVRQAKEHGTQMKKFISMHDFVALTRTRIADAEIRTIMEIGSRDGVDAMFLKQEYPHANVYAIEGLPENYDRYMKHLAAITSFNVVITNYDGETDYHKKNLNGIHGIRNRGDQFGDTVLSNLSCKRIDTVCREQQIDAIDMVKIDVEGCTYEVLESFGDLLHTVKIMHIETESYPFFEGQVLHETVCEYLRNHGFAMIALTTIGALNNNEHHQHDSVWVNVMHTV